MRVLRGQLSESTPVRDVDQAMLAAVSSTSESIMRVWCPPKSVFFGLRDTYTDGYDQARAFVRDLGYDARERSVGGRAVAYTGTTVAFARAEPVQDRRREVTDRYDRVTVQLREALSTLGVTVKRGEPSGAFCPGSHSLSADGKIVGIAQRIRGEAALSAGIIVTQDHNELGHVLNRTYDALDVEFDPASVGSISRAGGWAIPETVVRTVERALADSYEPTPVDVNRFVND